jgi:hypothetical protein
MFGLLRKSSFFYITHLFTFSWIGLVPSLEGRWSAFLVMAAAVPLWMSSSVLFAERMERYRFLRTVPITDREVVAVKLLLILGAGAAYFGILSLYILSAGERGGRLSVNFSTVVSVCLLSILLAWVWQVCIWKFGIGIMTPVILAAVFLQFLLVFLPLVSIRRYSLIGVNEIRLFQQLAEPLWFVFLLVAAGLVYYGAWRVAMWVFQTSDPE